jgi:hypothetical protein
MNAQEWIAEARRRIALNNETIAEVDRTSSREPFWGTIKAAGEQARKDNEFLRHGIRLIGASI